MIADFIQLIKVAVANVIEFQPVLYLFFGIMIVVSMWNLIWYFVKGSY